MKGSANVSVTGIPVGVVITGLGQTSPAGTAQNVTVSVVDAHGNPVPNYFGTIHFTTSDGHAQVPADYTFTAAADGGKHTFQVTFNTPGTQSLNVADTATSSLKASAEPERYAVAQILVVSGLGQSAAAGAVQSVTVTMTDSLGNVATGYVGTVHFTSSDGQAVLPANYTFTAADQGKHTFQVTFKTTGTTVAQCGRYYQ